MVDGASSHQRRANDVGIERSSPRLAIEICDASQRTDTGRIHETVDRAQAGGRFLDRSSARRFVSDVANDRQRPRTCLLRGFDESGTPACQERNLRSSARQTHPDATPESARSPDDDDLLHRCTPRGTRTGRRSQRFQTGYGSESISKSYGS
jgi:hypothetical protein